MDPRLRGDDDVFLIFYLFKHVGGFSSGGGVRRRREVVYFILSYFFQRPPDTGWELFICKT